MSYCGTCGGFQSPDCPYRNQPGATTTCMPAPNPHDGKHTRDLAAIAIAVAKTAGMVSENQHYVASGRVALYGNADFTAIVDELKAALA